MGSFFEEGTAADPLYTNYRDDEFSWEDKSAREFIERIWEECGRYCDADLPLQAKQHFLARFWELYLAYALHSSGVVLAEQRTKKGPDLRLCNHPVWIEAVTASAGSGPDAVQRPVVGKVHRIPDREIQLRLTSAIRNKTQKFAEYQREGIVSREDVLIIALNAAAVPNARKEMTVPRIVRVLFPLGVPVAHLDPESYEVVKTSYAFEDEVTKRSGSAVSTAIFLDPSYSHISAILYSHSDPINRPIRPGPDLVVVHNPLADRPLPQGLFDVGQEYWKEGEQLQAVQQADMDAL